MPKSNRRGTRTGSGHRSEASEIHLADIACICGVSTRPLRARESQHRNCLPSSRSGMGLPSWVCLLVLSGETRVRRTSLGAGLFCQFYHITCTVDSANPRLCPSQRSVACAEPRPWVCVPSQSQPRASVRAWEAPYCTSPALSGLTNHLFGTSPEGHAAALFVLCSLFLLLHSVRGTTATFVASRLRLP